MAKRGGKPQTPVDRFEEAAADLVRFHAQLSKKAAPRSAASAKRQKLLEARFDTAAAFLKKTTSVPPTPAPVDIVNFFNKVSTGVVNAQRNLDDQSADYLKTVATQPHALPSIFRIPKVTAEMKFGLQTSNDKGIDLLFYQDQTQAQVLNQQSVQFDIVAAPPPPNLVGPPALASIVRLKSDRQGIQKAAQLPAAVNDFDRVIIVEIIDPLANATATADTATRQYVLLFADGTGQLGIWWLQVLIRTGNASPGTILAFGKPDASLVSLQQFVSATGDRQKAFLAALP